MSISLCLYLLVRYLASIFDVSRLSQYGWFLRSILNAQTSPLHGTFRTGTESKLKKNTQNNLEV